MIDDSRSRPLHQMIVIVLLLLCGVSSARSATNQPPYYRVQVLEEFHSSFGGMMLNNRNALAILQPDDETGLVRFLFRGKHRTADLAAPSDARINDVNIRGTTLFWANYAGYIYRRGSLINLTNLLPYVYFNSLGINGRGHIVGGAQRQLGPPITAFSYYRGRHRMLEPLIPGATALAIDVNNHGEIVGTAQYDTNQPATPLSYHAVTRSIPGHHSCRRLFRRLNRERRDELRLECHRRRTRSRTVRS